MASVDLQIKTYEYWSLFLNREQNYLGRMCLVARREDAVDLFAMGRSGRVGTRRASLGQPSARISPDRKA